MKEGTLFRFQTVFILCILFFTGCQTDGNVSRPASTETLSPEPTLAAKPTNTPTPVPSPTSTPTSTSTLTPSPTHTITPSWTPVPTLPLEEALEAADLIYQDNGGCELPCVWGVTPGETTWEEVRDRFSPLGTISKGEYNPGIITYTFRSAVPPDVSPHEFGYYAIVFHRIKGKATIDQIAVRSHNISPAFDPRLFSILDTFGKPDQVWMEIITGFIQGDTVSDANYSLVLFYPNQGYIIRYSDDTHVVGRTLRICPWRNVFRDQPSPVFYIYSDKIGKDFKELQFTDRIRKYSLLEEFQDEMDTQSFYETYLNPDSGVCIDVDLDTAIELEVP